MSKKPMTWMDVIKEQLAKLRSEGKTPSIGDVTPYAKKEWAQIKSGKHPLYIQGSNKGSSNKGTMKKGTMKKGNKTQKMSQNKMSQKDQKMSQKDQKMSQKDQKMSQNQMSQDPKMYVKQMLSKMHLCKKCTSKIYKYMNNNKSQKGGDCGSCKFTGGKKSKKNKKMKGGGEEGEGVDEGVDEDESFVQIQGKNGLLENPQETDGTQKVVKIVE
jgi:hypothetical protein